MPLILVLLCLCCKEFKESIKLNMSYLQEGFDSNSKPWNDIFLLDNRHPQQENAFWWKFMPTPNHIYNNISPECKHTKFKEGGAGHQRGCSTGSLFSCLMFLHSCCPKDFAQTSPFLRGPESSSRYPGRRAPLGTSTLEVPWLLVPSMHRHAGERKKTVVTKENDDWCNAGNCRGRLRSYKTYKIIAKL